MAPFETYIFRYIQQRSLDRLLKMNFHSDSVFSCSKLRCNVLLRISPIKQLLKKLKTVVTFANRRGGFELNF